MLDLAPARLARHPLSTLELAITVMLWQASTGVFILALVQEYLPEQLGANAAFPGYALALYACARFLLQTPAGWLADRFGRKRVLAVGIAISLPSLLLMLHVQDASLFLLFSALYGAGSAAIWPAIMAYVGDEHDVGTRGRTLNLLNISQLLGLGLGTMVGVTLIDLISYQAAFIACLSFSALALAFACLGIGNTASRGGGAGAEQRPPLATVARQLLTLRMGLLAGIALLLSIGTTVQAPIVGAYTSEVLDTKMHTLGLMMLIPGGVAAILVVRFGHAADRFGRQAPLILGLSVAAVCYFMLSQTTDPVFAVTLAALAGAAYAISIPAWGAAALDATELGGRGLMLGMLATVQGFGGAAGQAIGGVTNAAWGPVAPFKLGAMVLLLAMALSVMHLRQQQREETPTRASR
jgi:DHA1 family multidrug resistance protein-like MFS transporter